MGGVIGNIEKVFYICSVKAVILRFINYKT